MSELTNGKKSIWLQKTTLKITRILMYLHFMLQKMVLSSVLFVIIAFLAALWFAFDHYISKLNIVGVDGYTTEPSLTAKNEYTADEHFEEQLRSQLAASGEMDYSKKNVVNILLVGEDNDYIGGLNRRGNADGLIIVSINKDTKQIVLTSIMRDLCVYVPNESDPYSTKITLSYHFGGIQDLIAAVETNLGVPIDNYVLVNYLDVIKLVDSLGGIEIDVDRTELYYMEEKINSLNALTGQEYGDNVISENQAGTLTLNGIQTAAYMRIRMAGNNDFERTERARTVLLNIKDKLFALSLAELNSVANEMLPCITTDLSQGEILSLLINSPSYLGYDMVSSRVPIDGSCYIEDIFGSTLVADIKANKEYLYKSIYEGITPEQAK